jgi:hypothetical protein
MARVMPFSDRLHPDDRSGQGPCPLCQSTNLQGHARTSTREYLSCMDCRLIFIPPQQFLSADDEKSCYDHHNNHPDDPDYRAFLNRLFVPMQHRLPAASHGLDFGSGPGPTLSLMFEEAGHSMQIYDHFYAPDPSTLSQQYKFITATEVVEHLHRPGFELDRLWGLLKPGGLLGMMTQLVPETRPFADWHYIKDPTHVCFFSRSTCKWLAEHWQANLTFEPDSVMLFQKPQ